MAYGLKASSCHPLRKLRTRSTFDEYFQGEQIYIHKGQKVHDQNLRFAGVTLKVGYQRKGNWLCLKPKSMLKGQERMKPITSIGVENEVAFSRNPQTQNKICYFIYLY